MLQDFTNIADAFDENGQPNPWYYELVEPEFNWRANDIQCALGLSQLAKLDRFLARRRAVVAAYDALLAPYAPIVRPLARTRSCLPAWHLYVARIDFEAAGITRAALMRALAGRRHRHAGALLPGASPALLRASASPATLPGADHYYARALSLPLSAAMDEDDVERVVDALVRILNSSKSSWPGLSGPPWQPCATEKTSWVARIAGDDVANARARLPSPATF